MKIEPNLESMVPQVELRVLYGPQAGSRLALAPGDYLLGSDDECSVILAGPRMEACHAKLSFDGDTPSVMPLDGTVCDAQGNTLTDTLPLTLGMPFELGGVWISVDAVDAPWPDPEAVAPLAAPAPHAGATLDHESTHASATETGDENSDQRQRGKRVLIAASALLALIAMAGIVGAAWLVQQEKTIRPVMAQTEAVGKQKIERDVRNLLAEIAPNQTAIVKTLPNGMIEVTAYVNDQVTQERLLRSLNKIISSPAIQIYVESEMKAQAKKILAQQLDPGRAVLKLGEVKSGTVTIQGAVASNSVKEAVVDALHNGVPGVRQVDAIVSLPEDLPAVLQQRISEASLTKKLQIIDRQPEFILKGSLNPDELRSWEKLFFQFNEEFGHLLPIRATLLTAQSKPPVNVQMIVGGPIPFVVTENGQHVSRGGEVNGHTLMSIRDNEVVFDGNERFKIPR